MKSRNEVPAPAGVAPDGGYGHAERAAAIQWLVEDRVAEAEKALGLKTPYEGLRDHLAYLLWKTLRNRNAGSATPKATSDRLDDLRKAAEKLSSELSELLKHYLDDQSVANDVVFLLDVRSGGAWDIWSIKRVAEDSRNFADTVRSIVPRSVGTKQPDVERYTVLSSLDAIAFKLTGVHSKYSYSDLNGKYSGPLFLLMRAFEHAEARARKIVPPVDSSIAKFISRAATLSAQATNLPQE